MSERTNYTTVEPIMLECLGQVQARFLAARPPPGTFAAYASTDGNFDFYVLVSPHDLRIAPGPARATPEPAAASAPPATPSPSSLAPVIADTDAMEIADTLGSAERDILQAARSAPISRQELATRSSRKVGGSFYQIVRNLIRDGLLEEARERVKLTKLGEQVQRYL